MRIIVLGYKERGRKAVPHIVYAGNDAEEAQRQIDSRLDEDWIRMETLRNPHGRKIKLEKRRIQRAHALHSELFTPPPAVTEASGNTTTAFDPTQGHEGASDASPGSDAPSSFDDPEFLEEPEDNEDAAAPAEPAQESEQKTQSNGSSQSGPGKKKRKR